MKASELIEKLQRLMRDWQYDPECFLADKHEQATPSDVLRIKEVKMRECLDVYERKGIVIDGFNTKYGG